MSVMIERAFDETKVKRGTGAQGGQFVTKGAAQKTAAPRAQAGKGRPSRTGAKRADPSNLSFDGKRGTGYGKAGGDKRVSKLQTALNRLGLTDGSGKKLKVDGKLGPKTTAAVKKAQRALGLQADGVVTPALLKKLASAKSLSKPVTKKTAPAKKAPAKATKKAAPAKKAPVRAQAAAPAKKSTPAKRPARSVNASF